MPSRFSNDFLSVEFSIPRSRLSNSRIGYGFYQNLGDAPRRDLKKKKKKTVAEFGGLRRFSLVLAARHLENKQMAIHRFIVGRGRRHQNPAGCNEFFGSFGRVQ